MAGLFRNNPATPEGKYLIKRRDGSVVEWPSFVIGARDPAAPAALRKYALRCERLGMAPEYVAEVRALAVEFEAYRAEHGTGTPDIDVEQDRYDDPATVEEMKRGHSA